MACYTLTVNLEKIRDGGMKQMFSQIKNRTFIGLIMVMIVGVLVLAACGGNNGGNANNNPGTSTPPTSNAGNTDAGNSESEASTSETTITGTVTVAGSTSVQPVAEELGFGFMEVTDARIEVAGGGSGAGVRAAQTGTADIGMASRAIRDDEEDVTPIVIAIDGIAVVVHPNNDVGNLTFSQVTDIFNGTITNWSEVGGSDEGIVVIIREEGSGTRDAFAEIVLGDTDFLPEAIIQNSTGSVREAISQDVNAIGFISLGGLNDSVKALNVDGVEPAEASIKDGSYAVARPFNFLVNASIEPNDVTQAFIDYVLSSEGQAIVADLGYVTAE